MRAIARSLLCLGMSGAMVAQQPGTLDSTFSGDGVVTISQATMGSYALANRLDLVAVDDSLTLHLLTFSGTTVRFLSVGNTGLIDTLPVDPIGAVQFGIDHGLTNVQFASAHPVDGAVYVRFVSDSGMHMMRLDEAHFLDQSFGQGGVMDLNWNGYSSGSFTGFRRLPSGKIMVWGAYDSPPPNQDQTNGYLMRLDDSFRVDSTFGTNGVVLYPGSTVYNYPYVHVIDVAELSDSTLAVGIWYDVFGPVIFGSSSLRMLDNTGIQISSTSLNPGPPCNEPFLGAMHVTAESTVITAVGFSFGRLWLKPVAAPMQSSNSLWPEVYSQVTVITSDVYERPYISSGSGWLIVRRLVDGQRDEDFGILHDMLDPGSRWAEVPSQAAYTNGLKVLPDGKLLAWGEVRIPPYEQ